MGQNRGFQRGSLVDQNFNAMKKIHLNLNVFVENTKKKKKKLFDLKVIDKIHVN